MWGLKVWFKKVKVDNRILGAWLSDKELTTKNWVYPKHLVADKLKKIENIFGKLQFNFTHTNLKSKYEDDVKEYSYRVIASDEKSVVIETIGDGERELQQWFFENEDVMYVLSNGNIEYFRRVSV